MASPLRIGIIGIGGIGMTHARALAKVPEARVVALCDQDPERLGQRGRELGVSACFTRHADMLAKAEIDAAYVCTHNDAHCANAIAALRADKHVFCEKPMALNAAQARRMRDEADRSKRAFQMGMAWRFRPESKVIRAAVERGDLGHVYHMRVVLRRRRGIPGLGGWFTTRARSGGGALIDIGVHFLDLVMWLAGHWHPLRASAQTYAAFGPRMKDYHYVGMWAGPPKLDGVFDVDDYATGLIRFDGNATLALEIAWAGNHRDESYVELIGDRGGVRAFDGGDLTFLTEHADRPADLQPHFDAGGNQFEDQAAHFVAACLGRTTPAATADQGLTAMEVLDAVYRSARQGRETRVGTRT